jgi:hypothetical protein
MRHNKKGYTRKNLVASTTSIRELQRLLDVDSESNAIQIVVEDRLLAEKLASAADRIATHGGLIDVFAQGARPRLDGNDIVCECIRRRP